MNFFLFFGHMNQMRTLRTSRAVVLAALLATVIEFWLGCLVYGPSVVAVAFVCFFCLWKLCTRIISDVRNRKKKTAVVNYSRPSSVPFPLCVAIATLN